MWRIEKHPKIWLAVYLGLGFWNTTIAITNDGWMGTVGLVLAILMGIIALEIGISMIVRKHSH